MNFNFQNYFKNSSSRANTYVVKQGDSLFKIAKEQGVSVEELLSANPIEGTEIYPGQVLIIPRKVPSGAVYFVEYVVIPNDTLLAISDKFDIGLDEIEKYNDISKLLLVNDQVIKIPMKYNLYTVKKEDSLESIISNSGLTLEAFMQANFNNLLPPGTVVYIK